MLVTSIPQCGPTDVWRNSKPLGEKKGGSRAFLAAKSQEGRAWQRGKSRKIHQRWQASMWHTIITVTDVKHLGGKKRQRKF